MDDHQTKTTYQFSTYFPAFKYFQIKEDLIILNLYTPEYQSKSTGKVYLDLKGNFISKKIDQLPQEAPQAVRKIGASGRFQGKEYQLIKNEEKEIWELHIIKING